LALHSRWRHALSSRLFTATPHFGPAAGALPSAPVGNAPQSAAEDYTTHTLYVPNSNDNTVSVVNLADCSSRNLSGCATTSPTISVGTLPLGVAVDEATDTVYVANALDGTVSVIDGATCNADDSSGCGQTPMIVPVGAFDNALAVDPVTDTVFVTNQDASPGTVSVIDGNSCNATHHSGCASQPEATIGVGGGPSGLAVNPVTDTVYVANTGLDNMENPVPNGNTVSVIDGATCRSRNLGGCAPVGTAKVGTAPAAVAVDPTNNSIYVANTYDPNSFVHEGTVSVLDGATCDAAHASGCAVQTPPEVIVGQDAIGAAVDSNNHSVYVTNATDDTVSVIDETSCNGQRFSGCRNRPPTIALGGAPSWPVVDPAQHTLYVVDSVDNNVAVLSDRTCDVETSFGCRHPAPTVPAGSFPWAAATDQRFNTVYVGDANAFQPPYTLSMIDTTGCNADEQSGCNHSARTLPEVDGPNSIVADQRTDSIYVATTGPLQVIAAATCNATTTLGCRHTASVPAGGYTVAVDPSTNTIYTLNHNADGPGYVSVIDGRQCNAADTSGCASQTAASVATVAVGNFPAYLAVDGVDHTLYVTNAADQTVSVIDTRHCRAGDTSQCASQTPPTVAVPNATPLAIAVNPATNTAYVADNPATFAPGAVSLIDTSHCRAGDTSQCASQTPATISTPAGNASQIQVDRSTNEIYIANRNDSSVSVIYGGHCNAADTSGCSKAPKIQVGSNPSDLTLDQATYTAYAANSLDNSASVFRMFGHPAGNRTPPRPKQVPPAKTAEPSDHDLQVRRHRRHRHRSEASAFVRRRAR
jgi:DNA-binding beta-propeller fold protein YncE